MRSLRLLMVTILLSGCAMSQTTPQATDSPPGETTSLPNLGAAPELTNEIWLNVDEPLRLADLRGKVVLLDMWTFD